MPVLFINEILANEPGTAADGEFVEIVNSGVDHADLSGWSLWDMAAQRHVFPVGTLLRAGEALVVFGGASAIPPGLTNAVAASTGALSLGNSGDAVVLRNPSGVAVDSVTYGSALAAVDGVSMNRDPDGTFGAPFALHTALSTAQRSPGVRVDGTAFAPPAPPAPPAISTTAAVGSVARDFALDLVTCELLLGPDGDWILVRDLDAIRQDAHTALGFIRGEWFLDNTFGFGLFDTVLVKSPNLDLIRAEVRRVLLTVQGITSVTSVEVTLDRAKRHALVTWSASTDVGELRNETTRIQA